MGAEQSSDIAEEDMLRMEGEEEVGRDDVQSKSLMHELQQALAEEEGAGSVSSSKRRDGRVLNVRNFGSPSADIRRSGEVCAPSNTQSTEILGDTLYRKAQQAAMKASRAASGDSALMPSGSYGASGLETAGGGSAGLSAADGTATPVLDHRSVQEKAFTDLHVIMKKESSEHVRMPSLARSDVVSEWARTQQALERDSNLRHLGGNGLAFGTVGNGAGESADHANGKVNLFTTLALKNKAVFAAFSSWFSGSGRNSPAFVDDTLCGTLSRDSLRRVATPDIAAAAAAVYGSRPNSIVIQRLNSDVSNASVRVGSQNSSPMQTLPYPRAGSAPASAPGSSTREGLRGSNLLRRVLMRGKSRDESNGFRARGFGRFFSLGGASDRSRRREPQSRTEPRQESKLQHVAKNKYDSAPGTEVSSALASGEQTDFERERRSPGKHRGERRKFRSKDESHQRRVRSKAPPRSADVILAEANARLSLLCDDSTDQHPLVAPVDQVEYVKQRLDSAEADVQEKTVLRGSQNLRDSKTDILFSPYETRDRRGHRRDLLSADDGLPGSHLLTPDDSAEMRYGGVQRRGVPQTERSGDGGRNGSGSELGVDSVLSWNPSDIESAVEPRAIVDPVHVGRTVKGGGSRAVLDPKPSVSVGVGSDRSMSDRGGFRGRIETPDTELLYHQTLYYRVNSALDASDLRAMKRQVRSMITSAAEMVELIQNDARGSMWRKQSHARGAETESATDSSKQGEGSPEVPPSSARQIPRPSSVVLDGCLKPQAVKLEEIFEYWAEKDRILLEAVAAVGGNDALERYSRSREGRRHSTETSDGSPYSKRAETNELELASSASFVWSDFLHGPVNQSAVQARSHSMEVLYIAKKLMEGARRLLATLLHAESNFEHHSKLLEEARERKRLRNEPPRDTTAIGSESVEGEHKGEILVSERSKTVPVGESALNELVRDALSEDDEKVKTVGEVLRVHEDEIQPAVDGMSNSDVYGTKNMGYFGSLRSAMTRSDDTSQQARDAEAGAQAVANAGKKPVLRHERALAELHGFAKMLDYLEPQSRYAPRSFRTETSAGVEEAQPESERSSVAESSVIQRRMSSGSESSADVLPHAEQHLIDRTTYEPSILFPAAQNLLEVTVLNRTTIDISRELSAARRAQPQSQSTAVSPSSKILPPQQPAAQSSNSSSPVPVSPANVTSPLSHPASASALADDPTSAPAGNEDEIAHLRHSRIATFVRQLGSSAGGNPGHHRSRSAGGGLNGLEEQKSLSRHSKRRPPRMDPGTEEIVELLDEETLAAERIGSSRHVSSSVGASRGRRSQGDKSFGRLSRGLRSSKSSGKMPMSLGKIPSMVRSKTKV